MTEYAILADSFNYSMTSAAAYDVQTDLITATPGISSSAVETNLNSSSNAVCEYSEAQVVANIQQQILKHLS